MPVKIQKKSPGEVTCAYCKGTGKHYDDACIVCGGTGKVNVVDVNTTCTYCKGVGFTIKGIPCSVCGGTGYTRPVEKQRMF